MTPLSIVAATLAWSPLFGALDLDARTATAAAIASTDATDQESLTLAKIAFHESRYVPRVVGCAKGTTSSGRGAFGVVARGPGEYAAACGFTPAAASLALARVRESVRATGSLVGYVCGVKRSANCKRLARMREGAS